MSAPFYLVIPGVRYRGETNEQAEDRERRTIEANRRMAEDYEREQRARKRPMPSMIEWARKRGLAD